MYALFGFVANFFTCFTKVRPSNIAKNLKPPSPNSTQSHVKKNMLGWSTCLQIENVANIVSIAGQFTNQAHSVAIIKHAIYNSQDIQLFLNPGVIRCHAAGQPLSAFAPQIQWQCHEYGEDNSLSCSEDPILKLRR